MEMTKRREENMVLLSREQKKSAGFFIQLQTEEKT